MKAFIDGVYPFTCQSQVARKEADCKVAAVTANPKQIKVRIVEHDLKEYLCVNRYLQIINTTKDQLKKATTPLLEMKVEELFAEMD